MKHLLRPLFAILLTAAPAFAQEWKTIQDNALQGGSVYVQNVMAVRYVGDCRTARDPKFLISQWLTLGPRGQVLRVVVREDLLPGQDELSWKKEHLLLVSKIAAAYPRMPR